MVYDLALIAAGLCMGGGITALILILLVFPATVSPARHHHRDTCKDFDMPSDAFNAALVNLVSAFNAVKDKAVADALANLPAPVTDTGPTVDADDTAALVAATPATS